MNWKSLFYLHILQAELTDVDFWKNCVLFRIRGLIPNLREGKGMKFCQGEGTLVISVCYVALAKKKSQVHRPPSDVFPSPCILCLLRLEAPSIVPLSPD